MWWSLGNLSNDDHDVNENGKKALGWYCQNNNFTRASRFVEDGNTRQQFSFSFPGLWYSPLELNSKKICQHLTNWTTWNKRDKVSSSANSLFKWRFASRRHRCCLKSLISHGGGGGRNGYGLAVIGVMRCDNDPAKICWGKEIQCTANKSPRISTGLMSTILSTSTSKK